MKKESARMRTSTNVEFTLASSSAAAASAKATPFLGRGVVGVGLGGCEGASPARAYAELFREAGFLLFTQAREK